MAANKLLIGWAEWCAMPDMHIPAIRAKIDTGAKTSALHAYDIEPFVQKKHLYVKFKVHPLQGDQTVIVECSAKVVDQRTVTSSNGHKQQRYVIQTHIRLGDKAPFPIHLTLTNRDVLRFRMLLGREALCGKTLIDPARKNCLKNFKKKEALALYAFET